MKTKEELIQEINSILKELEELKTENVQWTEDNFYILKRLASRGIDRAVELLQL